jgi:hypothetical protein
MRLITALAATALLASCQPADGGDLATTDTDAPAASSVAPTSDTAGAEAMVRALYARYDGPSSEAGEWSEDYWSARTKALLDENAAAAHGEPGYLGADPICACQDWDDFSLNTVVVSATGDNTANAAVTFSNFGTAHSQILKLVFEDGAWKVDDIEWTSGDMAGEPPLVEGVQASTAEMRAQG